MNAPYEPPDCSRYLTEQQRQAVTQLINEYVKANTA